MASGKATIYRSRRAAADKQKPRENDGGETPERLIEAKYAAPKGSAEHLMAKRQLAGLRSTRELASPTMEDLDPREWGAMCPNPVPDPEGKVCHCSARDADDEPVLTKL
jgi:hypothetical protein